MITTRTNVHTQSGNRIIIEMGGARVGLIQSCSPSDDYGLEPATGVGDIHVSEWVPTLARHTLSVRRMMLITQSLRNLGIATINGDNALQGLVFDILFFSRDSGEVMRKYVSCSWGRGAVDVSANRITMEEGTLYALDAAGVDL
ncbi:hypothetical protein F1645_16455 (plasmid) [Novacetimonas hansenii]|uniref:Uncharacterized protein n=1 Tax=Novacetimonas hansenii TaxID=436 RepID=A0ABQ0SFV0_NOVHA|nr:hypothetical protein [Novacetimonas hansenii]GAN83802.1 hypothetical protein Gaha_0105_037 [Novacetimonas hansenii JCM 7643]GBQ63132.1 hypothetical protein AA0243_3031 [Novacetimonas hansenii NRIC 0243]GEC64207.1 hypothetical protein GHA01_20560 [Novacetimonas hansenii]